MSLAKSLVAFLQRRDLVEAAQSIAEKGAQHVLISMAGDGAILVAADGTVYTSPAPKGTLVKFCRRRRFHGSRLYYRL